MLVLSLALHGAGGEVTVFENGEQLPGTNVIPPIDVKLSDGSGDLGHYRRLVQRKQDGLGGYGALNGFLLRRSRLHVDNRFRRLFLARTTRPGKNS